MRRARIHPKGVASNVDAAPFGVPAVFQGGGRGRAESAGEDRARGDV